MKITFPAMQAQMGGRVYYSTTMALSEVPRFFKFNDWSSFTPELRAQRTLNVNRIPGIASYILDNEDSYLFSSITCSYSCDLQFTPVVDDAPDLGTISLELEEMEFVINDGQHRCAAIAQALLENPDLASERISVLLFPMETLDRMQQMFSDLNRYANRSPKSLNILYDHRDSLGVLTKDLVEELDVFKGWVEFEKTSLPVRSMKLFTLTSIYDANKEFFGKFNAEPGSEEFKEGRKKLLGYWTNVAASMPDWTNVTSGQLPPSAVRQEKISSHSIVLRALGKLGNILFETYPESWEKPIEQLSTIDWRKSNGTTVNPLWDGVCITAGSVVSNKQARQATFNQIVKCLQLDEERIASSISKKRGRPRKRAAA